MGEPVTATFTAILILCFVLRFVTFFLEEVLERLVEDDFDPIVNRDLEANHGFVEVLRDSED